MQTFKLWTAFGLAMALSSAPAAAEKYMINLSIKDAYYRAAVTNKAYLIKKYNNLGYSIDALDDEGLSALCTAEKNGERQAIALLLANGANPNQRCMKLARKLHSKERNARWMKYGSLTLLGGAALGGAIALTSGSSSDGDGSEGGGSNSGSAPAGSNGTIGNSQNWNDKIVPTVDNYGAVKNFYDEAYFNNNQEYKAAVFADEDYPESSVNFLSSINAAEAFAHFYGTDENNQFASNLKENVTVGVMDSGVWGNNTEFLTGNGGTKVSGYNFDYGPCLNGDTTNCWKAEGEALCFDGGCIQMIKLHKDDATEDEQSFLSCEAEDGGRCDPYKSWAQAYPSDYDWDKLHYYFYSNFLNPLLADVSEVTHGTNVAGIIAANINNEGMMGVAGANTMISAVRWDLMSSMAQPLRKMLDDNVLAVNLSVGSEASAESNASLANSSDTGFTEQEQGVLREIITSYESKTNPYTGHTGTDGMILVKAAGNDSYGQPDLLSGIKLVEQYNNLMMLVVVAADVTLDGNLKVQDYKLSDFSNACGVTGGYCIAAPGGFEGTDNNSKYLYGPGGMKDGESFYIGMAGTSQAAPVVTGSIAFLKEAYPYMSSSEIIELIQTTANKTATDYSVDKYGAGLLDLGAAVTTYIADEAAGGGTPAVTTVVGQKLNSQKINLNAAHLSVSGVFKNALLKALPKSITVFDKYARPFDIPTANYVSTTHSGYKGLKNDVLHIARRSKLTKVQEGNIRFAYAGSAKNTMSGGLGFVNAEYQSGRNSAGFYFSENTQYDAENYFASDLKNPFMAFTSAYGVQNTFDFNNGLGFKIEAVTGQNGLYDGEDDFNDSTFKKQAYALNSELMIHRNKNFGFSLNSGMLYEDEAALGMNGRGAFDTASGSTYNAGVTAYWYATPKLTLSGSYFRGYTEGRNFASNLISTSDLVSESFAMDARYQWNKTTQFGLQFSSPLRVRNGTLSVNFPSGRDLYSDAVYRSQYTAHLRPESREYRFSAYWNQDYSESLSLRSEIGVRVHPEHQREDNDYRALFGLNWNFN